MHENSTNIYKTVVEYAVLDFIWITLDFNVFSCIRLLALVTSHKACQVITLNYSPIYRSSSRLIITQSFAVALVQLSEDTHPTHRADDHASCWQRASRGPNRHTARVQGPRRLLLRGNLLSIFPNCTSVFLEMYHNARVTSEGSLLNSTPHLHQSSRIKAERCELDLQGLV